jgi:CHAT domain-containing protein
VSCGFARAQTAGTQVNAVMRQVHELTGNLEYRRAERLALDAIQGFQKLGVPPSDYRKLTTELGKVYLSSGVDEQAAVYLADSWRQLTSMKRPSRADLRDEASIAVSLAKAYSHLGQNEAAIETLRTTLCRPKPQALDLAGQIELTVKLSALGVATLGPENASASLSSEVARLEKQLAPDFERSAMRRIDYARSLQSLADYRQANAQYEQAVSTLMPLVQLGAESELEGREAIAAVYRAAGETKREIEALQRARDGADKLAEGKPMRTFEQADVSRALADALARDKQYVQANEFFASSRRDYQGLLTIIGQNAKSKDPTEPTKSAPNSITVAKLELEQRLASVLVSILKLPTLATPQATAAAIEANVVLRDGYLRQLLPGDPRIALVQMTLGELFLDSGESFKARAELLEAGKFWKLRPQRSHLMRAITLSLLAEATLAGNHRAGDAEKYLREAEEICQEYLPNDELRWWIQLNRARLATTRGRYQLAQEIFEGLPRAEHSAKLSNKLRSSIALQESLLCKQLANFEKAEKLCRKALTIRQEDLDPLNAELLPYYSTLAGIFIAERKPEELEGVVSLAARICQTLPKDDERVLNTRHAEAMVSFFRYEGLVRPSKQKEPDTRHYEKARSLWSDLLKVCPEAIAESTIRVRVLHQLSRLEYLKWSQERAARLARLMSDSSGQAARYDEALKQYLDDIKAFEDARKQFEQQARHYTQKLEDFNESSNKSGPTAQLKADYKNLGETLAKLKKTKDDLGGWQQRLSGEVQRLDLVDKERSDAMRNTSDSLSRSEDFAQQAIDALGDTDGYVNLRFAVLCDSARALHAQGVISNDAAKRSSALERLQDAIKLAETARLGSSSDAEKRAEFFTDYQLAFDLLVDFYTETGKLDEALVTAERCRSLTLLDQRRALNVDLDDQSDDSQVAVRRFLESEQSLLYYYVGLQKSYVFFGGGKTPWQFALLRAPDGSDVRYAEIDDHVTQLHGALKDPSGSIDAMRERLASVSLVLLPEVVREFLKAEKENDQSHVTVVPHGKLSQLPLEGLVLAKGADGEFVADISPPLAYVPSLTLWDRLSAAEDRSETRGAALVSVGVTDAPSQVNAAAYTPGSEEKVLALVNEALEHPPKFARLECEEIAKAFGAKFLSGQASVLLASDATEAKLRTLLGASPDNPSPTILHIVAHGKVEDGAAWIQLLPSGQTSDKDGRLELADIYGLKLKGCELTVLSACETNLNSSRKSILDPSFSLASGFLAVGARRVLATEWEVGQESTTELVRDFVKRVIDAPSRQGKVNYVQMLAAARRKLRENPDHPKWRHPYYWAPFVLIGPAEGDSLSTSP